MLRKAVVFIAASVDGFIATQDGDLGFLSAVEKEGEDYGYADFISTVDTVVLGKKTYDKRESLKEQDTKRDLDRIKKAF